MNLLLFEVSRFSSLEYNLLWAAIINSTQENPKKLDKTISGLLR